MSGSRHADLTALAASLRACERGIGQTLRAREIEAVARWIEAWTPEPDEQGHEVSADQDGWVQSAQGFLRGWQQHEDAARTACPECHFESSQGYLASHAAGCTADDDPLCQK